MRPVTRRRDGERGYAVLMVFVMAATIAITLYMEMPRVAFESQRGREQLLVDRGNQYKRAIQVFYRKNKRFPASMDELDSFQNVRSLRRHYKDPMTGKDEWRLIHVGPNGVLTDSLVQKQQNPLSKDGTSQIANGNGSTGPGGIQNTGIQNPGFQTNPSGQDPNAQPGANGQPPVNVNGVAQGQSGINMALARRPSDRTPAGGQGGPVQAVDPNNPNAPPVQSVDPNQPGQPGTQPLPPNLPGYQQIQPYQNPQNTMPNQANNPNQMYPNQPFNPNNPNQPGQIGQYNGPGQAPNAANGAGGQNAAMAAIQQAIMSPRQPPSGVGSTFGTQTTGGIAGIASTFKGGSIKVINERHKYQEWEFVYDMKKDKTIVGNAAGMNMQQQQTTNPGFGGAATGGTSFGSGSGFGSSGGTGATGATGTSGFGSGSTTQTPQQPTVPNQ